MKPQPVEVENTDPEIVPNKNPKKTGQKLKTWVESHKLPVVVGAIIVLIAIGSGVWFLLQGNDNSKPKTTNSSTPSKTSSTTSSAQPTLTFSTGKSLANLNVLYEINSTDGKTYKLYLQEGTAAAKDITGNFSGSYYGDTNGNNAVVAAANGIYLSTDRGSTFNNIYPIDTSNVPANSEPPTVTGIKFSSNGQQIVFALLSASNNAYNTVKSINIATDQVSDLAYFNAAGVFILNYNNTTNQLIYETGCYFCDGGPGYPHLRDLNSGADKPLIAIDETKYIWGELASDSTGSNLIYTLGTNDQAVAAQDSGVGWGGAPPYYVKEVNVATGRTTDLATVGSLHEKNADGTYKIYQIYNGFTNDAHQPFYSADNSIFVLENSGFAKVSPPSTNVIIPRYVTAKAIIYEDDHGTTDGSFVNSLIVYDLSSKKQSTIYNTKGYDAYFVGAL